MPVPGQLSFPQRQRWRKDVGLRPTMRVDGQGTTAREEVALWEAVMESRYGQGETAGEVPQTPAARRTLRAAPSAASDSSQSGAATAGELQVRLYKFV